MICRVSILGLAFAVMAVTPLHAQGVKERSVQTDRNLRETNPARESVVKGAVCSCPRAGAPAIPCGGCVDGMTCTGNNKALVRNKAC